MVVKVKAMVILNLLANLDLSQHQYTPIQIYLNLVRCHLIGQLMSAAMFYSGLYNSYRFVLTTNSYYFDVLP